MQHLSTTANLELNVSNLDQSIDFYGRILMLKISGVNLVERSAEVLIGSQTIRLRESSGAQSPRIRHLAFEVESLDTAVSLLTEARVHVNVGSYCLGPERQARLSDPDGYSILFTERPPSP